MFGVQNDANNFGYSAGLLANTIANRPNRAALGTLFVSTDTLLLYRWTGSAWVEISGSGGAVTGAFNGCQVQGAAVGLGGTLTEATQIETTDYPIEFFAGATDTAQFKVITSAAISELAYFTSTNSFNDGGVYIGNFETFGTIQSKEYAGQTPTELRLNYDGGNIQLGNGDLGMYFDFNVPAIFTTSNTQQIGLRLDFDANEFLFGDFNRANNGTSFVITDNNSTIKTNSQGLDIGLKLDFSSNNYYFGDFDNNVNSTKININDDIQYIIFNSNVGSYRFNNVPNFANNAAAITGGLNVGDIYRSNTGGGDQLHIVH